MSQREKRPQSPEPNISRKKREHGINDNERLRNIRRIFLMTSSIILENFKPTIGKGERFRTVRNQYKQLWNRIREELANNASKTDFQWPDIISEMQELNSLTNELTVLNRNLKSQEQNE